MNRNEYVYTENSPSTRQAKINGPCVSVTLIDNRDIAFNWR